MKKIIVYIDDTQDIVKENLKVNDSTISFLDENGNNVMVFKTAIKKIIFKKNSAF